MIVVVVVLLHNLHCLSPHYDECCCCYCYYFSDVDVVRDGIDDGDVGLTTTMKLMAVAVVAVVAVVAADGYYYPLRKYFGSVPMTMKMMLPLPLQCRWWWPTPWMRRRMVERPVGIGTRRGSWRGRDGLLTSLVRSFFGWARREDVDMMN